MTGLISGREDDMSCPCFTCQHSEYAGDPKSNVLHDRIWCDARAKYTCYMGWYRQVCPLYAAGVLVTE